MDKPPEDRGHSRRQVLAGAAAGLGLAAPAWAQTSGKGAALQFDAPQPFSFALLAARAKALAAKPYAPPPAPDPTLHSIDFDAYGQINYDPRLTLWGGAGEPAVRFFPQGRMFQTPVQMHVVDKGLARALRYDPALFQTPADHPFHHLKGAGFAGFRVMNPDGNGDWLAFLGAAYFRAAGPFNQYGASARGIAINSGGPAPEEFPRFSAFWLERAPEGGLIAYALLEGPSVAGAYRIDNRRGRDGVVQGVQTQLFFRKPVETLGLAPITSMFWYGENSYGQNGPAGPRDWRPEIHDSDGLALLTGEGERIWRPLDNPPHVITNGFQDHDPKGFGLMQRDRLFDHYQDDGDFYEKRPSVWIEPTTALGPGAVRLLEIPTRTETDDNIGAFWTPARNVQAGDALTFGYRIHWCDETPSPLARVTATRVGMGGRPGLEPLPGYRRIAIDFEGEGLKGLTRASGVEGAVSADGGAPLKSIAAYPVVGTEQWRLIFDIGGLEKAPVNVRAYLRQNNAALSETWLYQLFPEK